MSTITLKDIARATGLDYRSVSHVLKDDPRYSAETRRRVREAAGRMGYVPHNAARRLVRGRGNRRTINFDHVGLIYYGDSAFDRDEVFIASLGGAEEALAFRGANVSLVRVSATRGGWEKVEKMSRAGSVDGWLIYGPVNDDAAERLRQGGNLPFVVLGDHTCPQPVNLVNIDNAAAGRMAAQHLASLGHRRVAYVRTKERGLAYQRETLAGFRAAAVELGLDLDPRLTVELTSLWDPSLQPLQPWDPANARTTLGWLQGLDPAPTAIFAPEFRFALTVFQILKQAPLRVPQDISLLGYERPSELSDVENFTHVQLPMSELGSRGAELLHEIVTAAQPSPEPREIKIQPALVEAGSTQPPSRNAAGGRPESNR